MIGLAAVAVILAVGWLGSSRRDLVRPRVVLSALILQMTIALIILKIPAGTAVIHMLGLGVGQLVACAQVGTTLLFGDLGAVPFRDSILITVLPAIIFFSALISILYHFGWMQMLIRLVGGAIGFVVGVGRIEAMVAAANIFVGQAESPLVVRPYLQGLSRPQIFALMTSGMAGVAGTVLAAYAQLGVRIDYLLAASFMSAPAGLLMAKLVMPDDPALANAPALASVSVEASGVPTSRSNVILVVAEGTQAGLMIAARLAAMLLTFTALIALGNMVVSGVGGVVGFDGVTIQSVLGHILASAMWLLGLSWPDAVVAGGLFGQKIILNEFVAYADYVHVQAGLSAHAQAIMTFALCGFANIGSIGIQMAVLGGIAPDRRDVIASLGFRALFAASLANLLNAAIAGIMIP